jgi:hypothetical protein
VGLSQDVSNYFFRIGVGCPVQRGALEIVESVKVDYFSEIQERHDYVLLGGEVERVEAGVGGQMDVGLVFFD